MTGRCDHRKQQDQDKKPKGELNQSMSSNDSDYTARAGAIDFAHARRFGLPTNRTIYAATQRIDLQRMFRVHTLKRKIVARST